MERKIFFVKNNSNEGPGIFEEVAKEQKIPYQIIDLDAGEAFPSPQEVGAGAYVVLGGPDSANDESGKMIDERTKTRDALRENIPYLGICLGLQNVVKAAGGEVVENSIKEIGLRDPDGNFFQVELNEDGKRDPLLNGLDSTFPVLHLHGETVVLADRMKLLGTGKFCTNQIVKLNDHVYGVQFHEEVTPKMFREWMEQDPDLRRMNRTQLEHDYEEVHGIYSAVARRLFQNFLKIAGF